MNERAIRNEIGRFVERSMRNLRNLHAEQLIDQGAINPLLMKALGFNDIDALARFYVYQRVGRSVMTGFGTTIERIVKAVAEGREGDWWDVVATIDGERHYMSVKSGPRDMDKDQVEYFSNRAMEILKEDPSARPIIAIGYGRDPWPIIPSTLRNMGLDPDEHLFVGRRLYEKISGETDLHIRLLDIIHEEATRALRGREVIDIIEDKVREISEYFQRNYNSVDELLRDIF